MPCLPGEGRSVLPFLLGIFMNSSVESLVTVHYRSGGPPWKGPMTMTPEPSLGGEAPAAESVSDELEIPKADGFAEEKTIARQTLVASIDTVR
jgi:hypothetical protein